MRNLRRGIGTMGVVAAFTSASMLVINCSGDDTVTGDGGLDGTTDALDSAKPDNVAPDADAAPGDGGSDAADGVSPIVTFRQNVANAFCTRFQNCCPAIDAGQINFLKRFQSAENSAWEGSNANLYSSEVVARGFVTLNIASVQSCLAGLATMSCPIAPSTEIDTLAANCFAAASGTLNAGSDCINSVEVSQRSPARIASSPALTLERRTRERCWVNVRR